jgi:hypothetical protein
MCQKKINEKIDTRQTHHVKINAYKISIKNPALLQGLIYIGANFNSL